MKKTMLRRLRAKCNDVLGEEKTDKIIEETVKKILNETDLKRKRRVINND